jgi:TrmH family RNA methyltransferase
VISVSKLASLPPSTRRRKIVLLLQQAELELERGGPGRPEYWRGLAGLLAADAGAGETVRREAETLAAALGADSSPQAQRRALNRTRHTLLVRLGAEPAEWDLLGPEGELDCSARRVYPISLYLEEVRSPFNVGAMFRAAEAFGVERVLLSPSTASPLHPRALKTSRGAVSVLPWEQAELADLADKGGLVALELNGRPLESFRFPARGVLLVGSEELGLSPEALRLAEASAGRVSIPMSGSKRSLNVAVACGIVLQAWFSRLSRG